MHELCELCKRDELKHPQTPHEVEDKTTISQHLQAEAAARPARRAAAAPRGQRLSRRARARHLKRALAQDTQREDCHQSAAAVGRRAGHALFRVSEQTGTRRVPSRRGRRRRDVDQEHWRRDSLRRNASRPRGS